MKTTNAADGHAGNRDGFGHQMGRWQREFCTAGEAAAALPVRGVQRGDGRDGQRLQEPGKAFGREGISVVADRECRFLCGATGLG